MSTAPKSNRTTPVHAPLPWHVGPYYKHDIESREGRVAECVMFGSPRAAANAEFIVRAVNAHDDLLATLKWAERQLAALVSEDDGNGSFIRGTGTELVGFYAGREQIRAAIAKAEGR